MREGVNLLLGIEYLALNPYSDHQNRRGLEVDGTEEKGEGEGKEIVGLLGLQAPTQAQLIFQ